MFKIIYQAADDLWHIMWKTHPRVTTRTRSTTV